MRGRRRRNGPADAPESNWVLVDFGDIVVHLFLPEAREYYGLENLWADVPQLPFTATAPRPSADEDGAEVRQPTLDGFGAFLPSAIEPEAASDESDSDADSSDAEAKSE
jgi:hypothetical protein